MPTASAGISNSNSLPEGPDFNKLVWKALLDIPFGTTTSYGAIARKIGHPNAARAVGAANGANPIALIVPCHRVIGSDGSLTGYGGGLPLKRKLLEHEARVAGTRFDFCFLHEYKIESRHDIEISLPPRLTLPDPVGISRHLPGQAVCGISRKNAAGKPV